LHLAGTSAGTAVSRHASRARGIGARAFSRLSSLVGAGCLALLAVSAAATVAAAGAAKGATLVKLAPNRCFCSASCRASLLPRGKRASGGSAAKHFQVAHHDQQPPVPRLSALGVARTCIHRERGSSIQPGNELPWKTAGTVHRCICGQPWTAVLLLRSGTQKQCVHIIPAKFMGCTTWHIACHFAQAYRCAVMYSVSLFVHRHNNNSPCSCNCLCWTYDTRHMLRTSFPPVRREA